MRALLDIPAGRYRNRRNWRRLFDPTQGLGRNEVTCSRDVDERHRSDGGGREHAGFGGVVESDC